MDLTLNIYKNRKEIEKTYSTDEYDLMFGTLEDLIKLVDFDDLLTKKSNTEMFDTLTRFVQNSFGEVKKLLKDIFPEATDDELRRTKVKEVVPLLVYIVKFTLKNLGGKKSKN